MLNVNWRKNCGPHSWWWYWTRDFSFRSKNIFSCRGRHLLFATDFIYFSKVPINWDPVDIHPVKQPDGTFDMPPESLATIRKHGLGLKGPLATPVGKGYRSLNLALRKYVLWRLPIVKLAVKILMFFVAPSLQGIQSIRQRSTLQIRRRLRDPLQKCRFGYSSREYRGRVLRHRTYCEFIVGDYSNMPYRWNAEDVLFRFTLDLWWSCSEHQTHHLWGQCPCGRIRLQVRRGE